VLRARALALVGFLGLAVSMVRGRVDEVWVGDSHAVFFASDRFPRLGIGSTEPRRWVWHLGPRLMYSFARDGYPPTMHRMLRVLRRLRASRDVVWIFSAGEIDLRCHLVPRLKQGANLDFVARYVEQVQDMAAELDLDAAAVVVPVPASDGLIASGGFPIVGTVEQRSDAHRLMRGRILAETGPATGSRGAVIHALDATDRLSDDQGHLRAETTDDGIHLNDAGRAEKRAAIAELRSTVLTAVPK
jgi:hypothetical protein